MIRSFERATIFVENHDAAQAGHLGINKTYQRLAQRYYWPGMYRDVVRYINSCEICQRLKVPQSKPAGEMGKRDPEGPWNMVAVDCMGRFPRSKKGFTHIIVYQDIFTKWIEVEAIRAANGVNVRRTLRERVVNRWGSPEVLITDNGPEFKNKTVATYCAENKINQHFTPPYTPQCNPVERVNRVIKIMIASYIEADHREWDKHLPEFQLAYNSMYHTTIDTTPAFLNRGRHLIPNSAVMPNVTPELPKLADILQWKERMTRLSALRDFNVILLEKANEQQAKYYNRGRPRRSYNEGDLVYRRQTVLSSGAKCLTAKLAPRYTAPLTIKKRLSPTVYELMDAEGKSVGNCHIKHLKLVSTANPGLLFV